MKTQFEIPQRNLKNNLLSPLRLFTPMLPHKKRQYINYVGGLVDVYQPKIEERTGYALGDIVVKPLKDKLADFVLHHWAESMTDYHLGKEGAASPSVINTSMNLMLPFLWGVNQIKNQWYDGMLYERSNIYVPLGYMKRFCIYSMLDNHEDSTVVHELSHRLWETVSGKDLNEEWENLEVRESKGFREWVEGFAEYCENNFFKDLYPNYVSLHEAQGIYKSGMEKVKKVIRRHGPDSLLEIPPRWEEFEVEDTQS
jgi:hypothetical protein